MAPDDRDRIFDKALTRHLRSAAPSDAAANLPAGSPSPRASCLDPESLAAYHERSLFPEEMNFAKEHIVGCAHCQAILAQLELTDSITLPAAEKKEVLVMSPAPAALAEKTRPSRLSRGVRWQWLAPAGALAAGLLMWVAWHENQRPAIPVNNEIKTAKAQEPSPPVPALTRQAPAAPSADQLDARSRTSGIIGGVTGGVTSPKPSPNTESLKQQGKFDSVARNAPARRSADKEAELRKDAGRDSSLALIRPENPADLDAKNVVGGAAGAPQEKAELQNQTGNIQTQNQMIAGKVAGPSPLSQVDQTKKAKSPSSTLNYRATAPAAPSQSAPAPAPPANAAAAYSEAASVELMSVMSDSHLVAVPGTTFIWRAGRAGVIEFSSDSGASWSRQTSGALVDLTTGSAPSDKICWIVGRVGAIVRTTDGGQHWSLIHPPIGQDLVAVRALDSLRATIWTAHNLKAFETTDGGLTWKPVSPP